jgi:hypothetical protein
MRDDEADRSLTPAALHLRELVGKYPNGYLALVAATRGVPRVADDLLSGRITPPKGQLERLTFAIEAIAKFQEMSRALGDCYGPLGLITHGRDH